MQTFDSSFFIINNLYGDEVFQNMFVYQPNINTVVLKEDKGSEHIIAYKSKVLSKTELCLLHA